MKLTPHRLETLRAVLAHGGAWEVDAHQGTLSDRRPFRTSTLSALANAGLLERVQVEADWLQHFRSDPERFWAVTTSPRYFVTAAGCRSVAHADALLACRVAA